MRLWLRRLVFWAGAVVVGAAAILFAKGATEALRVFSYLYELSPFIPLALSPAALVAVLWVTRRFLPGAEGSGIPQTIAAIRRPELADGGMLSLRIAVGKMGMTLVGLLGGASIGREGPTVQVGAAIMLALGRLLRLPKRELGRSLILAGGAAGIAGAFNTPLAGVVFAIEEMSRSFEERTSGTVLTTVIVAGIMSLAVLGDYTYFGHTSAFLTVANGWLPVLVCGVVCGVFGGLFSATLVMFGKGIRRPIGVWMRRHPLLFAAACGVALALVGIISDGATFGTGYDQTRALLAGETHVTASWGLLKMLATVISYVSGIPGGIFAPSLATGAGLGADIAHWLPSAPAGAVMILGMAAYFSGVVQAPITSVTIVMEMTDNQSMTVPLMAVAFIAASVSKLLCRTPLYKALAESFLPDEVSPRPAHEHDHDEPDLFLDDHEPSGVAQHREG